MKNYGKYIIATLSIITILVTLCFIPFNATRLIPMIEEQVANELGINIYIERLILRVGPYIKVKAPLMHIMYRDGQKFAQFDNVKFYLPWSVLVNNKTNINKIKANKLTVRVNSNDKYLKEFIDKLGESGIDNAPNATVKEYSITYFNVDTNNKYTFKGSLLELDKINKYKTFKIVTKGDFYINSLRQISYDISVLPLLKILNENIKFDFIKLAEHIKELDFCSDIIADLKIYKNKEDIIQASGFFNIDNVSILDATKKNPKSFAYVTLWGDKASVLSNIYTAPNQKIYIEGMANNSKKPVIDLKVKTDEIALNGLYNKLKIILDFSNFKNIKSVEGTLNANFNLKGDLNKIKSSGYLKISNASIKASDVEINRIDSDIDFSNNSVNIVKAIGYVNNSPIMLRGSINKKVDLKLLMNKVELKHLFPAAFGVKDGLCSVVSTLSGTLDNVKHSLNIQAEDLKVENFDSKLTINSIKYDSNKDRFVNFGSIELNNPKISNIKIPTLKVYIDNDNFRIPETNIFMDNSKLIFKGDCFKQKNNFNYNTILSGNVYSKDILKLKKSTEIYPVTLISNGNKLSQQVNFQTLLGKDSIFDESILVNLAAKYEKGSIKLEDLSLQAFNGAFTNDIKQNAKGYKKLILTGVVENLSKPVLKNIRIFIPQTLNINLDESQTQIKGDVFLNGNFTKPEIVGQINLQNFFNKPSQFSINNCALDFNKNVVVLNAPSVKIADNLLSINSLISTDFSKSINIKNLNIKSKHLNLETLIMYKDLISPKNIPYVIQDGKFYAERITANLYGKPLFLSAFSSDINVENNDLIVKNITSELFNGNLAGTIKYNLREDNFDSKLQGRGVSASSIFNIISNRKDSISGQMDFDSNIVGDILNRKSLKGNAKFIINNGRMATLGRLEHLLYAQNVVADNMLRTSLSIVTKAITLKDTGLFKFIKGDIDIENGCANINFLQTQGPLMSLYIKGKYFIDNDYAQLLVLGRLADEVMSGLGAFGDFSLNKLMIMLTGEENKYYIMPQDIEKLPQLSSKNTKEFRSIINGVIDKPSSVILFNWISYTQRSLRQKETPLNPIKMPSFVDELPY